MKLKSLIGIFLIISLLIFVSSCEKETEAPYIMVFDTSYPSDNPTYVTHYFYDDSGRIVRISRPSGYTTYQYSDTLILESSYGASGLTATNHYFLNSSKLAYRSELEFVNLNEKHISEYAYNSLGYLTDVTSIPSNGNSTSHRVYSSDWNCTSVEKNGSTIESYSYYSDLNLQPNLYFWCGKENKNLMSFESYNNQVDPTNGTSYRYSYELENGLVMKVTKSDVRGSYSVSTNYTYKKIYTKH